MSLVKVNNVSKYFYGRKQRKTVREHIEEAVRQGGKPEPFCALRNISFTVEERESVAFVGANGAGKSTMLSLICGLAEPDEGTIEINASFAPLLELGSGFHPDLTGRENIFMNAALLGMTERQVKEVFDEIVQFSELGDAIQEHVRVYSAGMVMRLAFSVAAHCQATLYVIDEVLGVGDSAFSAKCLAKIRDLRASGRSLVFVSHNPASVAAFCDRAIWLHEGRMVDDGPASAVVERYTQFMMNPGGPLPSLPGGMDGQPEALSEAGRSSKSRQRARKFR